MEMFQTRAEVLNVLDNTRDEVMTLRYEELDVPITSLRNNKATGADCLIYEIFKYVDSLHPLILQLYNRIFTIGHFPLQWTQGVIVPLFKKGRKDVASNYRGITLLDTLSKLFTKIINSRVSSWAKLNDVIAESQCGFRDNHSTIDGIYLLHTMIDKWTS